MYPFFIELYPKRIKVRLNFTKKFLTLCKNIDIILKNKELI